MLDPSLANPPPFTVVPGKRLQAALKLHPHTFQTARAWSREGSVHVSRLKVICKLLTWASGSSPVTPLGPCVPLHQRCQQKRWLQQDGPWWAQSTFPLLPVFSQKHSDNGAGLASLMGGHM